MRNPLPQLGGPGSHISISLSKSTWVNEIVLLSLTIETKASEQAVLSYESVYLLLVEGGGRYFRQLPTFAVTGSTVT